MSEISELFMTIKQLLKQQGITYNSLADKLGLSEASVKRMFSHKEITLSRLEQICAVLQLNFSDLIAHMESLKKRVRQLTFEQEKQLVTDNQLLLVTICVLNQWRFEDILAYYRFETHELVRCLAALDKMQIIELLPGNRIKRLLDPDFQWLEGGPIQCFFHEHVQADFLSENFESANALYLVRNGMLSEPDNLKFQQRLRRLANEFIQLCNDTTDIPIEKRHGTALMIAMRPWVPRIFDKWKC